MSEKPKSFIFALTYDKHDLDLTTKGPITKGNLMLEALCNLMKFYVSEMILCLMKSREKILEVKNLGNLKGQIYVPYTLISMYS